MLRDDLLGDWHLVTMGATTAAGHTAYPMGEKASGMIVYTECGHVVVNIATADRARPQGAVGLWSSLDDAAAAAMARSYMAYAGTFSVDESARVVTHHLQFGLDPNMVDTPQERHISFNEHGNLVLSAVDKGTGTKGFLEWRRAEGAAGSTVQP